MGLLKKGQLCNYDSLYAMFQYMYKVWTHSCTLVTVLMCESCSFISLTGFLTSREWVCDGCLYSSVEYAAVIQVMWQSCDTSVTSYVYCEYIWVCVCVIICKCGNHVTVMWHTCAAGLMQRGSFPDNDAAFRRCWHSIMMRGGGEVGGLGEGPNGLVEVLNKKNYPHWSMYMYMQFGGTKLVRKMPS